jgi:hypothetical protein
MNEVLADDLAALGTQLRSAAARHLDARARLRRRRGLLAVAAALACLTATTAVAGLEYGMPTPSTRPLNLQYADCIKTHGANWKTIPDSGGFSEVTIPPDAVEHCAALDLAREAAGNGHAHAATWIASIGPAPLAFWTCIGGAGFHVTNGAGQRDDYDSPDFRSVTLACAKTQHVTLPAYD